MTTNEYQLLINTLNEVTVRGEDNLNKLLAVIQYLKRKQKETEQPKGDEN